MESVRQHLIQQLRGGQAFDSFDEIVGEFSPEMRGTVPNGAERSPWQILEHMRIALRDILDYSQNSDGSYREKKWPEEYWPKNPAPSADGWRKSIDTFKADLAELEQLVKDGELTAAFSWSPDHTLLREILVASDHNAYHLGELVMLRRMF
jgi:hypothetical protein